MGVDAVVQISQGAQLGLKQDVLALGLGLAQEGAGVADEGLDLLAEIGNPGLQVVHGIGLGAVNPVQRQVLPLQNVRQTVPELFRDTAARRP